MNKKLIFLSFVIFLCLVFWARYLFALEEIIVTVPAQDPKGATIDLQKGEYTVKIEGGSITLFYPINPNYKWLIGVSVGTEAKGYQDEPDIGTLYFEPTPPVYNQADAEQQAIKAVKENKDGTFLKFALKQDKKVRFWVSDFDYGDNSGMVKLRIVD